MPVLICLLRGVNVGGHHKIKMDDLRTLCTSLKLRDSQTYVQSGNVVFRTRETDLPRLARRLEDAIERTCGFRPDVVLRTCSDLRDVIARNPFAERSGIEPNKLLVNFLAADPGEDARAKVRAIQTNPEELHIEGREIYIYYPHGMGRSKLTMAVLDRALKISGTGRNWNTVTRLLEMAERLLALE
jgi:uncharacterized protein (DUF1697 family)